MRVRDELPGQLGELCVALGERGEVRQPLADVVGGCLGGAAGGEEPQGAAVGGVDQLGDLVELGLAEPVPPRRPREPPPPPARLESDLGTEPDAGEVGSPKS